MKTDIIIVLRDVNGKRYRWSFQNEQQAYKACVKDITEEDEILIVIQDGVCVYSALQSNPITAEDLVGFFA